MSTLSLAIRAETTNLDHVAAATAEDQGPQDGVFDNFAPLSFGSVNNNGFASLRTALEFDISSVPEGATVTNASFTISAGWVDGNRAVALHGYNGDGTIQLGDFALNGLVRTTALASGFSGPVTFDATSFIGALVAGGQTIAGFNLREDPANGSNYGVLPFQPASARLSISYIPGPTSTINNSNAFAWGANLGWANWRGSSSRGVVIGEHVCSGYIYAANAGWIRLGNGSPTNGIQYSNTNGSDSGVNHDGTGNLRGLAWGANIGWVKFEDTGAPRFDLLTGKFSGYAYSANCGWISLSNVVAYVQTDTIQPGADSDGDGIADAYELTHAGNLTTMNAVSDSDGDRVSDLNEYRADTNPFDANDLLRITSLASSADGSQSTLTWRSSPKRLYNVQSKGVMPPGPWADSSMVQGDPSPATETARTILGSPAVSRFFRVQAFRPLSP